MPVVRSSGSSGTILDKSSGGRNLTNRPFYYLMPPGKSAGSPGE